MQIRSMSIWHVSFTPLRVRHWLSGLLLGLCSVAVSATPAPSVPALRDAKAGLSVPGKFVWADLYSSDPEKASAFYTQLFGWSAQTYGNGSDAYIVLSNGNGPLAGFARRRAPSTVDARGHWVHYAAVADIDKAVAAAEQQGGGVLLRSKAIPGRGKQALITDPSAAVIGLLQSANGDPEDYRAEVGDWVWMQLFTPDPAKSSGFYQQVFGYDVQLDTRFADTNIYQLVSADAARGAIAPLPASSEGHSGWVGFVRVDDLAKRVTAAQALGAGVLVAATPIPEINGQLAILRDPVGAVFGLLQISLPEGEQP